MGSMEFYQGVSQAIQQISRLKTFSVYFHFLISICFLSDEPNSSVFLSPMTSPNLPGPSSNRIVPRTRPPADSNRAARCSWILTRLFPDVSKIFLHTLLETREFDLLSTLETLVDMAQHGHFVPYSGTPLPFTFYPGINLLLSMVVKGT